MTKIKYRPDIELERGGHYVSLKEKIIFKIVSIHLAKGWVCIYNFSTKKYDTLSYNFLSKQLLSKKIKRTI